MSELVVPKHIADEDRKAAQQKVDEAYIKAEDRVLDPTLLNKSLLDRMPTPTGWRLLVLPYRGKGVTEGGIHLTDSTLDRESLATVVAYVLKVGPMAYTGERFSSGPWCQEGDWVLYARYVGSRIDIEGGEIKILNDDEIIATVSDPEAILHNF